MKPDERMLQLTGRYADGCATGDEVRELEAALSGGAELRRAFLRYLNLDAALGGCAAPLRVVPPSRGIFIRRVGVTVALAAAVTLALLVAWRAHHPQTRTAARFVTLTAANGAVWADPNVELALRAGELPPSALRLESGSAEFLCADGATVVLRGPAAVRFPERKRVFVEEGRIFCRCPSPASRLSVETSATEVVDLGTEFSVEARADRSTLVSVLSGEVQVGKARPRRLRKGEAVQVRGDGQMVIEPLAADEFSELLLAAPSVSEAMRHGRNLLQDPGFDQGLQAATWNGTESNLEALPVGGRSGGAVRIFAHGYAPWPQCRQKLKTGRLDGRLVVASVWAAPAGEPLRPRQTAMLKLVFVDEHGRDFAFAVRRFLNATSAPHRFEQAQVAAFAPAGTQEVQVQLMFQSNLQEAGAVIFDDASLVIADP